MAQPSLSSLAAWYETNRGLYDSLGQSVSATLSSLLSTEQINVVDIKHRAKSLSSFTDKQRRKRYSDPTKQMTDLCGVRVITLIERDVSRIADVIRSSFAVHANESLDKSKELGDDRFGYRSIHLICDVGPLREQLPEFRRFASLPFEVQIRTALQHAWAEIEHDRGYKFAGELPSSIKRRFHLVAGLLELADREFGLLTVELETYGTEAHEALKAGNLEVEMNSTTVNELVRTILSRATKGPTLHKGDFPLTEEVMDELRAFGLDSIEKLSEVFTDEFLDAAKSEQNTTIAGVLRSAMMYHDLNRYFADAWKKHWTAIDGDSLSCLSTKYTDRKVRSVFRKFNIDVAEPESGFWADVE